MPQAVRTKPRKNIRKSGVLPLGARRHPFVHEIENGLTRCGITPGDLPGGKKTRIIVGVSGGADSVALLLGLLAIHSRKSGARLQPIAVHVHHHLRPSADADARFVHRLCKNLGIEFHLAHVYPGKLPGNKSANARRLRYQALAKHAVEIGAQFVAVAHQGDDQLETMIAALCRGAGLDGLAGMPWSRLLIESIQLIRPLLAARRMDCEQFCRAAGVKWCNDPTNTDTTKVRARLRRDVLPVLEELWPDAARRVTITAELIRTANAGLERELNRTFGSATLKAWLRTSLQLLPEPVIAAGLRRAAIHSTPELGDELNQRHLMQAAAAIASTSRKPRQFVWPGGLCLTVSSKQVSILYDPDPRCASKESSAR